MQLQVYNYSFIVVNETKFGSKFDELVTNFEASWGKYKGRYTGGVPMAQGGRDNREGPHERRSAHVAPPHLDICLFCFVFFGGEGRNWRENFTIIHSLLLGGRLYVDSCTRIKDAT